ncbi:MAG: phosphoribosylformylglycinamidine synthase subunit PurL [Actinomycetia bacterium]|nr:phosphoribosylformylglycinamidine synthase subunit PurL [Actinomycetes bacterium]
MFTNHALVLGPAHTEKSGSARPTPRLEAAAMFGVALDSLDEYKLVHIHSEAVPDDIGRVADVALASPVGEWWISAYEHQIEGIVIETGLRPGVTDREGAELVREAGVLGVDIATATIGRRFVLHPTAGTELDADQVAVVANRVLHNEVIERWAVGHLEPAFVGDHDEAPAVEIIEMTDLTDLDLETLNNERRLGLDHVEMVAIRDHFFEIGRNPTDAELETLAQTWSEHCAHKTFGAHIDIVDRDGAIVETIDGLLSQFLRAATDAIDAEWVRSAFVDNAGIVAFDDKNDIALKAETHNHPSALEPFGGANTGVGGVVRDILGVSAKPIAVSDILCFGPSDLDPAELPDGVLHPKRIRDGVIAGVGDYGNKIGVPNIAGAIVHDPAYTTTPLVFAGCFGVLPTGSNPTDPKAGDSIVVLGGAVGRDGVGGATFSSQTMQAETAEVAGSSVQIGDPIVEKGLIDVVVAARDARLYNAITDCGAGGLSSSIGEMAQEVGAIVDLRRVPRKYPGLAPWEVWLSEAQERMVMAVPDPAPLLTLAERWGVGAAVVGTFTGKGRLVVVDGDESVIDIGCTFLHDGRPRRHMLATRPAVGRPQRRPVPDDFDESDATLELLAHPNIRSNEAVIRTYDHEVQGGTVVRPYGGVAADGPADGTAVIPLGTDSGRAMVIGIGVNCLMGDIDAEAMAWNVVDEAVRNAIIAGADPSQLSLLDNFAWGNPTDPDTLGRLVEACRGCHDAALAFGAPFVSGKDSLYNVFVGPDGEPDPVASTLVLTAIGVCAKPETVPLTGATAPGNEVWLVGPEAGSLGGSHLDAVLGDDLGGDLPRPDPAAVSRHHEVASAIAGGLVVSAHDLSEGGLAVAAAEWAFAGRVGLDLEVPGDEFTLFGEGAGRYLVEVAAGDSERFGAVVGSASRIGMVTDTNRVVAGPVELTHEQIQRAFVGGEVVS